MPEKPSHPTATITANAVSAVNASRPATDRQISSSFARFPCGTSSPSRNWMPFAVPLRIAV